MNKVAIIDADMSHIIKRTDISKYSNEIKCFEFNSTTSLFCKILKNPYSWTYQPSSKHESHRIICTESFAPSNNADSKVTVTIEFTDEIPIENIKADLSKIPLSPKYLNHHYNQYTYLIQNSKTKDMIRYPKVELAQSRFFFTRRFANWEFYNMNVSIRANMGLCKSL